MLCSNFGNNTTEHNTAHHGEAAAHKIRYANTNELHFGCIRKIFSKQQTTNANKWLWNFLLSVCSFHFINLLLSGDVFSSSAGHFLETNLERLFIQTKNKK